MSNDLTLFSPPELKDTVQDMRVMFKGVKNISIKGLNSKLGLFACKFSMFA